MTHGFKPFTVIEKVCNIFKISLEIGRYMMWSLIRANSSLTTGSSCQPLSAVLSTFKQYFFDLFWFVFADQTPTPTRFLRNCEEEGLFVDLDNPFDQVCLLLLAIYPSPPLSQTSTCTEFVHVQFLYSIILYVLLLMIMSPNMISQCDCSCGLLG